MREKSSLRKCLKGILILSLAISLQIISAMGGLGNFFNRMISCENPEFKFEELKSKDIEKNHNGTIKSTSNDSWFLIDNINFKVRNINITITDTSVERFSSQIYYSFGEGFNEKNSVIYSVKKGKNIIPLNLNKKVKALRLDITSLPNHRFVIRNIKVNDYSMGKISLLIMIVNGILLLAILGVSEKYKHGIIVFLGSISMLYCYNILASLLLKKGLFFVWELTVILILMIYYMNVTLLENVFERGDGNEK